MAHDGLSLSSKLEDPRPGRCLSAKLAADASKATSLPRRLFRPGHPALLGRCSLLRPGLRSASARSGRALVRPPSRAPGCRPHERGAAAPDAAGGVLPSLMHEHAGALEIRNSRSYRNACSSFCIKSFQNEKMVSERWGSTGRCPGLGCCWHRQACGVPAAARAMSCLKALSNTLKYTHTDILLPLQVQSLSRL